MSEDSATMIERLVKTCGQIGVTTNTPEFGMTIGPPAESEYAVEPVDVEHAHDLPAHLEWHRQLRHDARDRFAVALIARDILDEYGLPDLER